MFFFEEKCEKMVFGCFWWQPGKGLLKIKAFEAPEQDAPAGPQAHVAALPVPAFASCGSEKGICGLVTSILLSKAILIRKAFCRGHHV